MVLGRRCREITEFRSENQLFLKNEEDVGSTGIVFCWLKIVIERLQESYLFWYDPFYRGNFKFKAKLGLGAVLLTLSYHSDSNMGHVINYLLTGCSCRTRKYKALGFPNSPRKLGLYEKPWACISWYGPCTQLVNSNYWKILSLKSHNTDPDRTKWGPCDVTEG